MNLVKTKKKHAYEKIQVEDEPFQAEEDFKSKQSETIQENLKYCNLAQALLSLVLLLLIYKGYQDIRKVNFSRPIPKPNFPSRRASLFAFVKPSLSPTNAVRSHIASMKVTTSIPSLQPTQSMQSTTSIPTLQPSTLLQTSEMAKLQNWDTSQMELNAENVMERFGGYRLHAHCVNDNKLNRWESIIETFENESKEKCALKCHSEYFCLSFSIDQSGKCILCRNLPGEQEKNELGVNVFFKKRYQTTSPNTPSEDPNGKRFIPQIIHQTYESFEDLPNEARNAFQKLKSQNPTWEYRFYSSKDREQSILEHYGEDMLATYHLIDEAYGAARADFWRYLIIHAVGGVYLDIKSGVSKPLDQIIRPEDHIVITNWDRNDRYRWHADIRYPPYGEIPNWFCMSEPGHPFLKKVINTIAYRIHHFDVQNEKEAQAGVLSLTGPYPFTESILFVIEHNPNVQYTHYLDFSQIGLVYKTFDHMKAFGGSSYMRRKSPVVPNLTQLPPPSLSSPEDGDVRCWRWLQDHPEYHTDSIASC